MFLGYKWQCSLELGKGNFSFARGTAFCSISGLIRSGLSSVPLLQIGMEPQECCSPWALFEQNLLLFHVLINRKRISPWKQKEGISKTAKCKLRDLIQRLIWWVLITEFTLTPQTYFRGQCVGEPWTFGDQRCPNETGYEWLYRNSGGAVDWAYEGLTVKCIEKAGTFTWFGDKIFLIICCM